MSGEAVVRCGGCIFFKTIAPRVGSCRRNPPATGFVPITKKVPDPGRIGYVTDAIEIQVVGGWPQLSENEGCAEGRVTGGH